MRNICAAIPTGEAPTASASDLPRCRARAGARHCARPPADSAAWTWGARGSFSQFYFRDQSTTKFVDASRPELDPEVDNSVNVNQLLTAADLTISGGNDRDQMQMRAAGAYTCEFPDWRQATSKSLTALYLDYPMTRLHMSCAWPADAQLGAGVLGRFDGVLLGWQVKHKIAAQCRRRISRADVASDPRAEGAVFLWRERRFRRRA